MYKHILVPLDGSELAECVLGHVVDIVKACSKPRVTLMRVVTPLKFYGSEFEGMLGPNDLQRLEDTNMSAANDYLVEKAKQLKRNGIDAQINVTFGVVIDALTDFVDKEKVDLIVIATHGRSGVTRWVWGSVADRVLRTAKSPVLMIRPIACQHPSVL